MKRKSSRRADSRKLPGDARQRKQSGELASELQTEKNRWFPVSVAGPSPVIRTGYDELISSIPECMVKHEVEWYRGTCFVSTAVWETAVIFLTFWPRTAKYETTEDENNEP